MLHLIQEHLSFKNGTAIVRQWSRFAFLNLLICFLSFLVSFDAVCQLPAFPGAEGYGKFSKGGRGGTVIYVTNLNDSGSGSFREACRASGPRTVVFAVGGRIDLKSKLDIVKPFLTVAGQTAPGDGIMITGKGIAIWTNDVVIRGIKRRNGVASGDEDGITPSAGTKDLILDHCSFSWATDENIGFWGGYESHKGVENVTIQNCLIAEGLDSHYGMLLNGKGSSKGINKITIYRNLFANHKERHPFVGEWNSAEVINNVVYGYDLGTGASIGSKINIIGNFYKTNPGLPYSGRRAVQLQNFNWKTKTYGTPPKGYVRGNIGPLRPSDDLPEKDIVWWKDYSSPSFVVSSPALNPSGINDISAFDAYNEVLEDAGAIPRDAIDSRIINDVKNGTGEHINHENQVGGMPSMNAGTAVLDTDQDGMPDSWELSNGLDPNNSSDGKNDQDNDGYTNLEEYLNSFFLNSQVTNASPSISGIADQNVTQDETLGPLDFSISDNETDPDDLIVFASSDKESLISSEGISFGGSGTDRTVVISPEAGQFGTAKITVTISDGTDESSTTFTVVVEELSNTAPTITSIPDQTIAQDEVLGPLTFEVGDSETSTSDLIVTATSNKQSLLQDGNLEIEGNEAERALTLTPEPGQFGTATITVTVSDGSAETYRTFSLVVTEALTNTPPTISPIDPQSIAHNEVLAPLSFTIGDAETDAGDLTVTASSNNAALVSSGGLLLEGNMEDRTLTITPEPDQYGTVKITLEITDGELLASTTFHLTILDNDTTGTPPGVSDIPDQTMSQDETLGPLDFTVGDAESETADLIVTATSANQSLIPDANLVLGGSDSTRTLDITPESGAFGNVTITVTVSDGVYLVFTNFDLSITQVGPSNTTPVISSISDQTIDQEETLGPISFTIDDAETASEDLVVSASPDNNALLPVNGIILSGSGSNRSITLAPEADQFGVAKITLTVSDNTDESSTSFDLTVNQISVPNTPPGISSLPNQKIAQDESLGPLDFTVSDKESDPSQLIVTIGTNNSNLVAVGNIVLVGEGSDKTITITPKTGKHGKVTIYVTVSDGSAQRTMHFDLEVAEDANEDPTISHIPDQEVAQNGSLGPVNFTVGDTETPANELEVVVISSDQNLVPQHGMVMIGENSDRSLTITPTPGQFGTVRINLEVSDGEKTKTTSFILNVVEKSNPGGPLEVNLSVSNNTCYNLNDGTIVASGNGGLAPYSYSWSNGADTDSLENLPPGSYTVTVTDSENTSISKIVEISAPTEIQVSGTVIHESGSGNNGEIRLQVSGVGGSYSYSWSHGAFTKDVIGLTEGSYTVVVTDAKGCSKQTNFIVDRDNSIQVTASIENEYCDNQNGTIALQVGGGASPYTYAWSNGSTTSNLSGLGANTYKVVIKDNGGKAISRSYVVEGRSSDLVIGATIEYRGCGNDFGSIELNVTGGVAPFSFSWAHGARSKVIDGLKVGSYVVTVGDANGCSKEASFEIRLEPSETTFGLSTDIGNASCQITDGFISVNVTEDKGAPYKYKWSTGAVTNNISNLAPGDYALEITDKFGCFMQQTYTVNSNPGPLKPAIEQYADSLVTGQANFYQWYKDEVPIAGANERVLIIKEGGAYSVVISGDDGCSSTSDVFFASQIDHLFDPQADIAGSSSLFKKIDIYPNPASDHITLNVHLRNPQPLSIALYDSQGFVIWQRDLGMASSYSSTETNLTGLPSGFYLIQTKAGEETVFRKFIKY